MINPNQLLKYVIDPVLDDLMLNSESARKLLLYTAATETNMGSYIKQHPTGPALGIYQMEGKTYYDIWDNYLKYKPDIKSRLLKVTQYREEPDKNCLIWDLRFSSAMARLHYLRWPESLPDETDDEALIRYYYKYWGPNPNHTSIEMVRERIITLTKGVNYEYSRKAKIA